MSNENPITDPSQIEGEISRRFASRKIWYEDMPENLEPLKAVDGFTVSVQASSFHYCQPRNNTGPYITVECGFPSEFPSVWVEWAEDKNTTETIFGWIPLSVVALEFSRRGGLV